MSLLISITLSTMVWLAAPASGAAPDSSRAPVSDSARAGVSESAMIGSIDSTSMRAPVLASPSATDSIVIAPVARDAARAPRRVDYLWVLRSALIDPASVDSVVERAVAIGARGLLVQVVGRGDAYYRSDLLPRAEALDRRPRNYDPLGELLRRAKPKGLEVHAWVNCMLVWSNDRPPRDPLHVVNQHPEWIARMKDGRSIARLSARERKTRGVEGVFLSPAHPRVRTWVANVAREIAERYPVDGIHLDYIRQPDVAVGFDPTTRAHFALENGVDPDRFDVLSPEERRTAESAWTDFQRDQVTAIVREVRDSLDAVRPNVQLSAAVFADTAHAEGRLAQPWRAWVRGHLLDRVFLMCYAPPVQKVMDQLLALVRDLGVTDRVVPGIAIYNSSTAAAALKIKGARALGFPLLALYSYDSLFSKPSTWVSLRRQLDPAPVAGR